MKTTRSISRALCSALALFVVLQGCSDDDNNDNPKPPSDVTPSAGTSSKGGSGGTGNGNDGGGENSTAGTKSNNGGTKSNNGGKGGTSNNGGPDNNPQGGGDTDPLGGAAGGNNIPEPTCDLPELGDDGCFNCPANGEVEQWLNRCVDSDCEPFDNSPARLPLLKSDGALPPLPN
ncbi:MAG TPA: hypothetical protein VEQ59_11415 [Polyangiaceae bacterium]|nr:hypothetical protein [Polyangiaceae bacterium]